MSSFLNKEALFKINNNVGKDVIGDIFLMKEILNSPIRKVSNSLEDIFHSTKNSI